MKRYICFLLCFVLCLFAGCGKTKEASKTLFAMDTVMELKVWGPDGEEATESISVLLQEMENTWSAQTETSALSRINAGEEVSLTKEQEQLLSRVTELSKYTGGAFDPRLLAVSRLWNFTGQEHAVPSVQEITLALEQDQWDLGAALKGYAGQQAVALLEQMDVDCALLNLGGNIQTYGEKADGTAWNIGIQDPDGGDYIGVVSVTGTASVVTSGDYQRYFEAEGVHYHHILDPGTGYPADSGLRSVTVVCRDGLIADALSTALFVMGLEKSTDFWRQNRDFEAVFITTDGKLYATQGANLSGCEYEVIGCED